VEQQTGDPEASRELLDEFEKAVKELKKARQLKQDDKRKAELDSLRKQLADKQVQEERLKIELEAVRQELRSLRAKLNELDPSNRPPLEGTVQEVTDGKLLVLSIGSDDGVRKGEQFEIYRLKPKPVYVGRAEVTNVQAHVSAARLIRGKEPHAGDHVARELIRDAGN
jgi:hypothetical protein